MYEIRPETLKTFVEDSNIKLPRFQRKQTWDSKKNFELCISLFKEYPIGVTILNLEKSEGKTTRWLLDGRQRRNALSLFYNDPESAYNWAKKFIGFKNSDQPAEIETKFWDKISEYLEDEDEEDNEEDSNISVNEDKSEIIELDDNSDYDTDLNGLSLLLHIIKLTHNKTKKSNGFTRPFDFSEFVHDLPYTDDGLTSLNSRKVKSFIKEYKSFCDDNGDDYQKSSSFVKYGNARLKIKLEKKDSFNLKINRTWESIFERIDILDKITNLYLNSKIGLIEVKQLKSTDSQKIFNIINSKGTKLTAVEILSAKPNWNKELKSPTEVQKTFTEKLYKEIEVKADGVVKWDLPATIIDRLNNKFFFKEFSGTKSDFEKKLTLGFKLLSGIYEEGVKKDDIDQLGLNTNINWDVEYETIISELNIMFKLIMGSSYFKFLNSYRFSLMDQLSDAITLNFVLLLYKDWKRKGKPIGSDTSVKILQKNAFILLDNLIYEYITRQWRGSSDGLVARNLTNFKDQPSLLTHLPKEKWAALLDEIFNSNTIEGAKITSKKILEPVLLHFYALNSIQGPDSQYSLEIDHIIPQSLFKSSSLPDKDALQHNLFNLAVLPKDENISKSNKRLVEISNEWLKGQVTRYTSIEDDKFGLYSDLANVKELKDFRSNFFYNTFDKIRESLLIN
ncbi:MAG: DUF262 domain-containing protein [Flavobacterium sp.]